MDTNTVLTVIPDNLTCVVILDVFGIYVQIYDQGYFTSDAIDEIKQQYSDPTHWQVVVIEGYIHINL